MASRISHVLTRYEIEADIENLYVQEGGRLESEAKFHIDHYGVPSQHMTIISAKDGGTVGTIESFEAEIAIWNAILKEDEVFRCDGFDGSSTESVATIKALCEDEDQPYHTRSLYCKCEDVARCSWILDKQLHSIMLLDPTLARLKHTMRVIQ
jgi:hypothetical protein